MHAGQPRSQDACHPHPKLCGGPPMDVGLAKKLPYTHVPGPIEALGLGCTPLCQFLPKLGQSLLQRLRDLIIKFC